MAAISTTSAAVQAASVEPRLPTVVPGGEFSDPFLPVSFCLGSSHTLAKLKLTKPVELQSSWVWTLQLRHSGVDRCGSKEVMSKVGK
jgi:hypothetical protein